MNFRAVRIFQKNPHQKRWKWINWYYQKANTLKGKGNRRTARGHQGCARYESGCFFGCCNFVEHEIELEESALPHREGARRLTPNKSDACRKEIETLLEYDIIEPSKSPWACGVRMTKKKGDQFRFCCDFRYLNSVTVKDAYPIPRID